MAKIDTRTIKSKTCKEIAEAVRSHTENDYTELACVALQDILIDEQIEETPDNMTVHTEDDKAIFTLEYLAERLVRIVGKNISDLVSRFGDEIAETVEC